MADVFFILYVEILYGYVKSQPPIERIQLMADIEFLVHNIEFLYLRPDPLPVLKIDLNESWCLKSRTW